MRVSFGAKSRGGEREGYDKVEIMSERVMKKYILFARGVCKSRDYGREGYEEVEIMGERGIKK